MMFFLKNEHLNSQTKLIELSFLGVNMLGYLILDLSLAFSYAFSLELFFILGIFLVGGILQLRLYSSSFKSRISTNGPPPKSSYATLLTCGSTYGPETNTSSTSPSKDTWSGIGTNAKLKRAPLAPHSLSISRNSFSLENS